MALGWLSGFRSAVGIGGLIARKRYARVVKAMRARFAAQSPTFEKRLQYADLLVEGGRNAEAVPVLLGLADELIAEGFVERAISTLRKVLNVDPQADLKSRLAILSAQLHRRPRLAGGSHVEEAPGTEASTEPTPVDNRPEAVLPAPVAPDLEGIREKASEALQAHFGESNWSPRMRLRLAGLLHKAGNREAAVTVLTSLSDDLSEAGHPAKALAVLERVDRLRKDTTELRLAPLSAGDREKRPAAGPKGPDDSFDAWVSVLVRERWTGAESPEALGPI